MTFAQALAIVTACIGCLFVGMCAEHHSMKRQECETAKGKYNYKECLKP